MAAGNYQNYWTTTNNSTATASTVSTLFDQWNDPRQIKYPHKVNPSPPKNFRAQLQGELDIYLRRALS